MRRRFERLDMPFVQRGKRVFLVLREAKKAFDGLLFAMQVINDRHFHICCSSLLHHV